MTNNNVVYQNLGTAKHYKGYVSLYNSSKNTSIGRYGTMADEYLKKTAPIAYEAYRAYNEFQGMLKEIDDEAEKMMLDVKAQLKRQYPTPKTDDFSRLSKHSGWIEGMAEEIVVNTLVQQHNISDDEITKVQGARHGKAHN